MKNLIIGIGNIYLETNYLGLNSGGADLLKAGREYRSNTYETRLGGSVVNFAIQIKKLGFDVSLIGKIGKDEMGKKLLELLEKAKILSDLIIKRNNVQTSIDTGLVFAHNGQNIQVVSGNANQTLSINNIDFENPIFKKVTAIYLGGFFKQELLYKDYPKLLGKIKKRAIKIFLDHGRIPVDLSSDKLERLYESFKFVDGYFPNESELLGVTNEKTIERALEKAVNFGQKFLVLKRGEKGCIVKTEKEEIKIDSLKVNVINTVGAGDIFNAAFISQYLDGRSLKDCAKFANKTAAIKISQNFHPTTEEVKKFIIN